MDDLYKKIKNTIDDFSDPKSSQYDWDSFQGYRKKKDGPKSKALPWLLISTMAVLALLLGSNIFWATRYDNLTNVLNAESLEHITTIHDTIYITKINEKSNLINNKTVKDLHSKLAKSQRDLLNSNLNYNTLQSQYTAQRLAFTGLQSNNNNHISQLTNLEDLIPLNESQGLVENENEEFYGLNNSQSTFDKRNLAHFDLIPTLSTNNLKKDKERIWIPTENIWIKNKKTTNLLNIITPKSLSINLNTGFQTSINNLYGLNSGRIHNLSVFSFFNRHVRGMVGVSLYRGVGEIDGKTLYPNVPSIVVPEGESIKELKITSTVVGLNIGLEYMIYTSTKWRPYIGLGYTTSFVNQDNFSFEIATPKGEYYITPYDKAKQDPFSHVSLSIGSDQNLNKRIDLRYGVNYYQGLSYSSSSYLNVFGGVYYHF